MHKSRYAWPSQKKNTLSPQHSLSGVPQAPSNKLSSSPFRQGFRCHFGIRESPLKPGDYFPHLA